MIRGLLSVVGVVGVVVAAANEGFVASHCLLLLREALCRLWHWVKVSTLHHGFVDDNS